MIQIHAAPVVIPVSTGSQVVKEYVNVDPYEGSYTVVPSDEEQILEVGGYRMTRNLTINPIPSNYGKITWNGAYLTVS